MDLMRLLRSLEEFLYELIGWLVFYPRTFWRILRHPGAIALHPQGASRAARAAVPGNN